MHHGFIMLPRFLSVFESKGYLLTAISTSYDSMQRDDAQTATNRACATIIGQVFYIGKKAYHKTESSWALSQIRCLLLSTFILPKSSISYWAFAHMYMARLSLSSIHQPRLDTKALFLIPRVSLKERAWRWLSSSKIGRTLLQFLFLFFLFHYTTLVPCKDQSLWVRQVAWSSRRNFLCCGVVDSGAKRHEGRIVYHMMRILFPCVW
jgi:hypothetical protein